MKSEEVFTVDARRLAELLGLSLRTIRRFDSAAVLPRPIRIGGAVRWRYDELKAWIASGCPDRRRWESAEFAATRPAYACDSALRG